MTAGIVLASWLHEALHRAAAQRSAWTRRRLRVRAGDVEVLLAAGYVRRVGELRDAALYEITDEGRAVLARGGRT